MYSAVRTLAGRRAVAQHRKAGRPQGARGAEAPKCVGPPLRPNYLTDDHAPGGHRYVRSAVPLTVNCKPLALTNSLNGTGDEGARAGRVLEGAHDDHGAGRAESRHQES
jgi:hypothetical protein